MKNCTCDKLDCDSSCLCACHREGSNRIEEAIDLFIERIQAFDLKK